MFIREGADTCCLAAKVEISVFGDLQGEAIVGWRGRKLRVQR